MSNTALLLMTMAVVEDGQPNKFPQRSATLSTKTPFGTRVPGALPRSPPSPRLELLPENRASPARPTVQPFVGPGSIKKQQYNSDFVIAHF